MSFAFFLATFFLGAAFLGSGLGSGVTSFTSVQPACIHSYPKSSLNYIISPALIVTAAPQGAEPYVSPCAVIFNFLSP